MRKSLIVAATVLSAVVFSVAPVSIKKDLSVSQDTVRAEVGKPLSAGSVAGVHRRHERRDTRKSHSGSSSSSSSSSK